ncbi:hypothetical protein [Alteraurantiacibacter aquimixticola]|uniref:UrcA family protein n=1 Tax=Alteraurantiacibacter aquimixticola TaxID=2489173 RepID=A0A4T3EWH3_9SPHN|nr:hypothetical protein [Alteraurantiacibacter aquimixticola]TIX48896.1 hypothetical protein E5222_14235 [Alteraurantiacibacter aquimixticola]
MKTAIFTTLALLAAAPAAAQTMPLIIENGDGGRITITAPMTEERMIQLAAENACEKPFIRDLKGWSLYAVCITDARAEAEAILAARKAAGMELALLR